MPSDRIYKVTSIGRPLDPAFPTNKAMMGIVPAATAISFAVAAVRGDDISGMGAAALTGLLLVFGSWALARELAPDDNPGAFIGMAMAYVTYFFAGAPSLLLLFACLFQVRIANRTVGLPARTTDSVLVLLLTLWTVHATQSFLLGAVAALAFVFDATLRDPLRRQWLFAGLSITGAAAWAFFLGPGLGEARLPAGPESWLVAIISILYTVAYLRTRSVDAVGDVTGVPLSISRVRGGMFIGLLVAAQALMLGVEGLRAASAIWATLAGIGVGSMVGFFKPDRLAD